MTGSQKSDDDEAADNDADHSEYVPKTLDGVGGQRAGSERGGEPGQAHRECPDGERPVTQPGGRGQ